MNKEELREKRNRTIETLDDIKAVLGLDELYIDELEKENAELKADNDARKFAMAMSEKVEKQLRKENAELKEHYESVYENLTNTHRNIRKQLTKAKELLKQWLRLCNTNTLKGIIADTEQFLSEVEK